MSDAKTVNWPLIIGLPLIVFLTCAGLALSSFLRQQPDLTHALTYDFAFTAPILYLALIWRTSIPKITVVPVFVLGLFLASWLLPDQYHTHLNGLETYFLPIVGIGVLIFAIFTVRRAVEVFRKHKSVGLDFYDALRRTTADFLPRSLANGLAMELGVVYYGLLNWRKRDLAEDEFSYHRRSGTPAVLGAFIFLVFVELISVHILLSMWSHLAAWILTTLSLYSGLQVLGIACSLAQRPVGVEDDILKLPYGIMAETEVDLAAIEKVEQSSSRLDEDDPLVGKLSPLGELERHNVVLHLRKSIEVKGLYGMKKEVKTLALHLDDPQAFSESLQSKIKISE